MRNKRPIIEKPRFCAECEFLTYAPFLAKDAHALCVRDKRRNVEPSKPACEEAVNNSTLRRLYPKQYK